MPNPGHRLIDDPVFSPRGAAGGSGGSGGSGGTAPVEKEIDLIHLPISVGSPFAASEVGFSVILEVALVAKPLCANLALKLMIYF